MGGRYMKRIFTYFLLAGLLLSLFWGCKGKRAPIVAIDVDVQADFSLYEKRELNTPLYTRLSPEPLTAFVPSGDYGTVFPFVGVTSTYFSNMTDYTLEEALYGFVDETGRILVDPLYTSARLLENDYDGTALPYWVVTINETDNYGFNRQALISVDGTFATDFDYSQIRGHSDYIVARRFDSYQPYRIFDPHGKVLLSTEDLPFGDQIVGLSYCDNGLFLLKLSDFQIGSKNQYYFMDIRGNLVLGPYDNVKPFSCGWASLKLEDGTYTYIDREGNLMGRTSTTRNGFVNGCAVVESGDRTEVISTDGKALFTIEDFPVSYFDITSDHIHLYNQDDDVYRSYSFDGQLLWEGKDVSQIYGTPIYLCDIDPSAPYLYHVDPGKKVDLPPVDKNTTLFTSPQPLSSCLLLNYYSSKTDRALYRIYSLDLTLLYEGTDLIQTFLWEQPGEKKSACLVLPTQGGSLLHDPAGNPIGLSPIGNFSLGRVYESGYMAFTDPFCSQLYDPQGNLIFSYPLLQNMDD